MAVSNWRDRGANVASMLGWAVATCREAQELAKQRRMRSLRLAEAERDACADELAEQFALGRLDDAEPDRRVDLLHRAVTHGDLGPVFAGLPMPALYAPAVRTGRWRWRAFAAAMWLALPFALIGVVLAVVSHAGVAAVFVLPALVWVAFWWRWASAGNRRDPTGPR